MRIGVTILKDIKGDVFVYSGQGEVVLPLAPLTEQKDLVKTAAVGGMKIGGKVFESGMVVSQFGIETRKSFPSVEGKKSKK